MTPTNPPVHNPSAILDMVRRRSAGLVSCGHNATCLRYRGKTWALPPATVEWLRIADLDVRTEAGQ